MKALILVALLAHVAVAQSGALSTPVALTNSVTDLAPLLPAPGPGMTHVRLILTATFDQSCTITSSNPAPFACNARFCDTVAIGGASMSNRALLPMLCDFGATTATARTQVTLDVTVPIGAPIPMELRSRSALYPFPFGEFTTQTGSYAGMSGTFEYR